MVILWGPLVIGGGAAVYPKVKNAFGIECTHVLRPITGPGREQRRNDFITTLDEIAERGDEKFDKIVEYAGIFMRHNNNIMIAVKKNPFWMNYIYIGGAVTLAAGTIVIYYWNSTFREGWTQ